jgi:hypothetical protein
MKGFLYGFGLASFFLRFHGSPEPFQPKNINEQQMDNDSYLYQSQLIIVLQFVALHREWCLIAPGLPQKGASSPGFPGSIVQFVHLKNQCALIG